MKISSLFFILGFGLLSSAFANNQHVHAKANTNELSSVNPGSCEIEIINDSFDDLNVYGRFDDGSYMFPFVMKHWSEPQYVNLYYLGTCHAGMDFYIETTDGKFKYNGFTPVGKTIKIKNF